MLEQVTAMRQQTAKRRDAIKAEVEDMRALLAAREADLAAHERDVETLEQQMQGQERPRSLLGSQERTQRL